MNFDLNELARTVENASDLDDTTIERAIEVIGEHRFEKRRNLEFNQSDLGSTDAIIHIIDEVVPGWTIQITGKALEADGHWKCHLRRSTTRDNDEFIGTGSGAALSHAVLAALLRTIAYQIGREQIA